MNKRPVKVAAVGNAQEAASYLLVLIGCDGGEHGLREVECFHSIPNRDRFGGRKVAAEILANHVNSRLVFVHGVKNDLKRGGDTSVTPGLPLKSLPLFKLSGKQNHKIKALQDEHSWGWGVGCARNGQPVFVPTAGRTR